MAAVFVGGEIVESGWIVTAGIKFRNAPKEILCKIHARRFHLFCFVEQNESEKLNSIHTGMLG